MVSPPCGPFSAWQRLISRHGKPTKQEMVSAHVLLDFAVQVCKLQHELGNYYVFEHPSAASSWHSASMQRLGGLPGCVDVCLDQCMCGLRDPVSMFSYKKFY